MRVRVRGRGRVGLGRAVAHLAHGAHEPSLHELAQSRDAGLDAHQVRERLAAGLRAVALEQWVGAKLGGQQRQCAVLHHSLGRAA